MPRVVGIDHLVLKVSDLAKSRAFYDDVLRFLGFKLLGEYPDMIGWTNGKTRLWISQADAAGRKRPYRFGNVGFHHYAFELASRAAVDALARHLEQRGVTIADPAGEYYDDYYAVFFLDPDGMKLEGMKYGKARPRRVKKRAVAKRKDKHPAARKRRKRS